MDWVYELSLWIEPIDWVYELSLWIESMDWAYGLSLNDKRGVGKWKEKTLKGLKNLENVQKWYRISKDIENMKDLDLLRKGWQEWLDRI